MDPTTEWSKYDSKYAVIAALITRVHNLEAVRSHGSGGNTTKTTITSLYGQGISDEGKSHTHRLEHA